MTVKAILQAAGHSICYLEFIKRNGDLRQMWAIPHVKQELLAGTGGRYNPTEHRVTVVRDMLLPEEDCLRAVRWDSVIRISACGVTYSRDDNNILCVERRTQTPCTGSKPHVQG